MGRYGKDLSKETNERGFTEEILTIKQILLFEGVT
jgi:hypothetical protein